MTLPFLLSYKNRENEKKINGGSLPTGVQNSHSAIGWERKEKKEEKKKEEEKERNKSRIMKRIFKNPLRMMTMFFLTDVLNLIATLFAYFHGI